MSDQKIPTMGPSFRSLKVTIDSQPEDRIPRSVPPSDSDSENSGPSSVTSRTPSNATPPTSPVLPSPLKVHVRALEVHSDTNIVNCALKPQPIPNPCKPFDPLSLFDRKNTFLQTLRLDSLVPIAAGGFGRVWKALGDNEKVYALKLVERRSGQEKLLRNELRALRYARGSSWTVGVHHIDTADKYLLFVMDYYDGGDLMDMWEDSGGPFDPDLAIFWAAELIIAIHDLHLRGIVHRDIKFENIMLENGHVRIIDFGLAATFDHDRVPKEPTYDAFHRLKAGKFDSFPPLQFVKCNPHILFGPIGTPGYVPPEALAQRGYSFGVDYYAMGIVLHGMLTDRLPYVLCREQAIYDYRKLCIDPDNILDPIERDFLEHVLSPNPHKRPGLRRMKAHPIFSHIDWDALAEGQLDPPGYYPASSNVEQTL